MLQLHDNLTEGEVVGFRLNTGEEIICKLVKKTGGHYEISKPMMLGRSEDGGIGFMPYSYLADADKPLRLYKTAIAGDFTIHADFVAGYEKTTTGIEVPSNKIIT